MRDSTPFSKFQWIYAGNLKLVWIYSTVVRFEKYTNNVLRLLISVFLISGTILLIYQNEQFFHVKSGFLLISNHRKRIDLLVLVKSFVNISRIKFTVDIQKMSRLQEAGKLTSLFYGNHIYFTWTIFLQGFKTVTFLQKEAMLSYE